MRNILLTLFVFQFSVTVAQKHENKVVDKIIKQFAVTNVYELSNTVGFAGTPSQQLLLLDTLLATGSTEFLLKNAQYHKNAVVRLYCYKALQIKNSTIPPLLNKQFSEDNNEVLAVSGCLMENTTVKEFYKKYLFPSS